MHIPAFPGRGLAALSLLGLAAVAPAQILNKTITFTRFGGPPDNLRQAVFTYNQGLGTTSFAAPTTITTVPGADGVLFAPDGDVIVGGQGDAVHKVVVSNGSFTTVTAGGVLSFHVMLDPSGTKVWTAGNLGALSSVPIAPFVNGTPLPLSGDDTLITHMAFAGGKVYYTASTFTGNGNFGTVNLLTGVTTRLQADVPWAHGMCLDCYTGHVMAFGNNAVAQINPANDSIVSLLNTGPLGLNLDQGTSDGDGHLYIASNTGHMLFVDLTISGLVGAPDFTDAPFLDTFLDDIAPDCGLGAPPVCPHSQGFWKTHPDSWPVSSLQLGCQVYTKAQCIALMGGGGGDASKILVRQLVAAKLNVLSSSFNWPSIVPVISQADALLCTFAGSLPYGVPAGSPTGQQMVALGALLDDYNTNLKPCQAGNDGDLEAAADR